jgi:chromosome segregation ATPase
MTIDEFKKKIQSLKNRHSVCERKIIEAQTLRKKDIETLNEDFGIQEEDLESNIEKLQEEIDEKKEKMTSAIEAFDKKLDFVEGIVNG